MKVYLDGIIPVEMTEEEYNRFIEQEEKIKKFTNKIAEGVSRKLDEEIMKDIN